MTRICFSEYQSVRRERRNEKQLVPRSERDDEPFYYLSRARTVLLSPERADKATRRRLVCTYVALHGLGLQRPGIARGSRHFHDRKRPERKRRVNTRFQPTKRIPGEVPVERCDVSHVWPSLRRSNTRVSARFTSLLLWIVILFPVLSFVFHIPYSVEDFHFDCFHAWKLFHWLRFVFLCNDTTA